MATFFCFLVNLRFRTSSFTVSWFAYRAVHTTRCFDEKAHSVGHQDSGPFQAYRPHRCISLYESTLKSIRNKFRVRMATPLNQVATCGLTLRRALSVHTLFFFPYPTRVQAFDLYFPVHSTTASYQPLLPTPPTVKIKVIFSNFSLIRLNFSIDSVYRSWSAASSLLFIACTCQDTAKNVLLCFRVSEFAGRAFHANLGLSSSGRKTHKEDIFAFVSAPFEAPIRSIRSVRSTAAFRRPWPQKTRNKRRRMFPVPESSLFAFKSGKKLETTRCALAK